MTSSSVSSVEPPLLAVRQAVSAALAEDLLPLGDLTSFLVDASRTAETAVVARQAGVLAGRLCALESFRQVDPVVEVDWRLPDGADVAPGTIVAEVRGRLRSILAAERTALNFLCHLSGVATATRRVVEAVATANPATQVVDTRKTLPGLRALQKAAVRAGGGRNHRGSLSDGILVKDNHLGGVSIAVAVARAREQFPLRMIEVECDRRAQAIEAASAGAHVVLLDNMTPDEVADTVLALRAADHRVVVEVSGGLSEQTAPAFAAAGADVLSFGALTHSAPALDFGLDLSPR
ncbi:MAG: carboxylating nicotinate-nucleotide diphosphorylase [Actinomycetota bacterium]|nr:carboxylating nicotinate-nucleotide diphosphorylase [Actinomycetota bacterium]